MDQAAPEKDHRPSAGRSFWPALPGQRRALPITGISRGESQLTPSMVNELVEIASTMKVVFKGIRPLDDEDVTLAIRTERAGNAASRGSSGPGSALSVAAVAA